jgi:serine/threonine protein kinase
LLNKLKANPHPNIVDFRGSYTLIEKKTQGKTVKKGYIQMEKGLTNLKAYLSQRKDPFTEDEITSFLSSMLDGFAHLQKIEVAHRDIKPSNILVFDEDPLEFKICDVGAGTAVGECDNTKERTVIGTPYYLSPELYLAFMEKLNLTNYKAYKSDVYSLGLLFIEFCLGKKVSERLKNEAAQVAQKIKEVKEKYPNIIGLGKVLRAMLEFEVSKRMDFLELRQFIT